MVRIRLSALLALIECVCVSAAQSQQDSVALLTGARAVSELGAAVTVLDVDSLRRAGAAGTLADLLTARVPGVAVFHGSGTIGTASRILIRGATSFQSGDAPQIYVDGIRIDDDAATLTIAVGGQNTSRVDDLNVEDIATIAVLPGPAATALYGSDAANGVLLVTTKRGMAGGPRPRGLRPHGPGAAPLGVSPNNVAAESARRACAAPGAGAPR